VNTASPVARQRLPDRRLNETFDIEVAGLRYTATIGRFPDGRVGEIFINNHKSNSAADTNARDSAIVCSIALQYGAPLEVLRKALSRDAQGRASGPLAAALDIVAGGEP
jgi:hypothetical protein